MSEKISPILLTLLPTLQSLNNGRFFSQELSHPSELKQLENIAATKDTHVILPIALDPRPGKGLKLSLYGQVIDIPLAPAQKAVLARLEPLQALVQSKGSQSIISVLSSEHMQTLQQTLRQSLLLVPLSTLMQAVQTLPKIESTLTVSLDGINLLDQKQQPLSLSQPLQRTVLMQLNQALQNAKLTIPANLAEQLVSVQQSATPNKATNAEHARAGSVAPLLSSSPRAHAKDISNVSEKTTAIDNSTEASRAAKPQSSSVGNLQLSANQSNRLPRSDNSTPMVQSKDAGFATVQPQKEGSTLSLHEDIQVLLQRLAEKNQTGLKLLGFSAHLQLNKTLTELTFNVIDHKGNQHRFSVAFTQLPKQEQSELLQRVMNSPERRYQVDIRKAELVIHQSQQQAVTINLNKGNGEHNQSVAIDKPNSDSHRLAIDKALSKLAPILSKFDALLTIKNDTVSLTPKLIQLGAQLQALASIKVEVNLPQSPVANQMKATQMLAETQSAKRLSQDANSSVVTVKNTPQGTGQGEIQSGKSMLADSLTANNPIIKATVLTPTEAIKLSQALFASEPKIKASSELTVNLINSLPILDPDSMKLSEQSRQQLLKIAVNQINMDMKTALAIIHNERDQSANSEEVALLDELAPLLQDVGKTPLVESVKSAMQFQLDNLPTMSNPIKPLSFLSATDTVLKLLLGLKSAQLSQAPLTKNLITELSRLADKLPPQKAEKIMASITAKSANRVDKLNLIPQEILQAMSSLRGHSLLSHFQSQESTAGQGAVHAFIPFVWQQQQQKIELLIKTDEQEKHSAKNQATGSGWQFKMRLNAGSLGDILVSAHFLQQKASFAFYTESQRTASTIDSYLPKLTSALSRYNIQVDSAEVSVTDLPETLIDLPPTLLRIKV